MASLLLFEITIALVVQLTISFILSLITQVITTGTSSDLSWKVWLPLIKVTFTELSISNLRHAFTITNESR